MRARAWLKQSLDDIIGNPVAALQVSVLPLLIGGVVGGYWLDQALVRQRGFWFVEGRFVWWMWGLGIALSLLPAMWTAVAWHRFVLLGERPLAIAPRLQPLLILGYLWRYGIAALLAGLAAAMAGVTVFILLVPAALIGTFVLMLLPEGLRGILAAVGGRLGTLMLIGAVVLIFVTFLLRWAPFIVGGAVDRPVPMRVAWEVTYPAGDAIVGLAGLIMALAVVFAVVQELMGATGVVLGGYVLVSSWVLAMLNVGALTTVHRLFAEGVALPTGRDDVTPEI